MSVAERAVDLELADAGGEDLTPLGSRARSRALREFGARVIVIVVVLIAMLALWEALVVVFNFPVTELPSPLKMFAALSDNIVFLLQNTGTTLLESLVGYVMAIVIAIPLGIALARPGRLATALNTGALTAQIFPKIAVAPLFTIWFGFGPWPKFLFVFLLAFFPIMLNTAAGFAGVPQEIHDLGTIIGLRPMRQLWKLEGPMALPHIFAGLKISASFAVTAAIVYEFIGSGAGLGFVISSTETNLNVSLMFAALLLTAVVGFLFYGVVAGVETLAIPWHISKRRRH